MKMKKAERMKNPFMNALAAVKRIPEVSRYAIFDKGVSARADAQQDNKAADKASLARSTFLQSIQLVYTQYRLSLRSTNGLPGALATSLWFSYNVE
jgi:hypothetical protein